MCRLLLLLTAALSSFAEAESYVCPVELIDDGLIELKRSGDALELTHAMLGTRTVQILGESDLHLCGGLTELNAAQGPVLYLLCVDKADRSISVTMTKPFGQKDNAAKIADWKYAKCFVKTDGNS